VHACALDQLLTSILFLLFTCQVVKSKGLVELWYLSAFRRASNLVGVASLAEVDCQPSCMSDVRADQDPDVPCDDKEIGKAIIYCMAVFHGGAYNRTHFTF
jgi:hypothetical protein